jgi:hypothetical protein
MKIDGPILQRYDTLLEDYMQKKKKTKQPKANQKKKEKKLTFPSLLDPEATANS